MKKVVALLLAMLMIVSMAACGSAPASNSGSSASGSSEKSDDTVKIAVLMTRTTEKRYNNADIPAMEAEAKAKGFEITVQSAEQDGDTQQQQAEIAIMQGADVIILQPVNVKAGAGIVKSAHEEGIPVICYNDIISDAEVDGFVGRDSFGLGYQLALKMIDLYPSGNYVITGGDETAAVARLMQDGYHKALEEKGQNITVVSEQFNSGWDAESAMQHIEGALLANNDDIQAVLCSNDGMAAGVVQALDAAGVAGKVGLCGQDCEDAAIANIKAGKMSFTAFTEFSQMGKDAIDLAEMLVNGEDVSGLTVYDNGSAAGVPWIPTTVLLVDKDNVAEFEESHAWWFE